MSSALLRQNFGNIHVCTRLLSGLRKWSWPAPNLQSKRGKLITSCVQCRLPIQVILLSPSLTFTCVAPLFLPLSLSLLPFPAFACSGLAPVEGLVAMGIGSSTENEDLAVACYSNSPAWLRKRSVKRPRSLSIQHAHMRGSERVCFRAC